MKLCLARYVAHCTFPLVAIQVPDLGSNFFLVEGDVGKPRATATAPRLAELNPLVRVEATNEDLTEDLVARHDAVIITSGLPQVQTKRSSFAKEQR